MALGVACATTSLVTPAGAQNQPQETPPTSPSATASATIPQSEIDLLRAQMAAMQARLDKLEADQKKSVEEAAAAAKAAKTVIIPATQAAAWSPTGNPVPGAGQPSNNPLTSRSPVEFLGLFQIHSLNYFGQNGPAATANDTFRLRRAEIRINAPRITSRVSGTIQLDAAKASFRVRVPATPGNVDTRARDSLLQEVQITYLLKKRGPRTMLVDVGQFKIPIGLESLQVSQATQLVERSLIYTQRDPYDGGDGDVRDTGVQLRGTTRKWDYRLGIFNGVGDRQNTFALSDTKAMLGRLAYKPNTQLEVGVSGGVGNTGTGAGAPRANRHIYNAFGFYRKDKVTVQGEYLMGDASLQNGPTTFDIRGYYGSVGYLFRPKIEGIFRYDYLDTNHRISDAAVRDLILGVNYYMRGNQARIQTNLVKRTGAPGSSAADLRNDRFELRTNFQLAF
jgi:hypothetical protein